jgi:hypothetical protein
MKEIRKLLLAALLVVLSVNALHAADPVFPHGSAIGLVPPQGMALAKNFAGFQDEAAGASIMVVSMIPSAKFLELSTALLGDVALNPTVSDVSIIFLN